MGCSVKQNTDGSTGFAGPGGGQGEFVALSFTYDAASIDRAFFTASRRYIVKSVIVRPTVAGTNGSAVTLAVAIAPDGTAIASGTAVHSGTGDLKGTIHTNQELTLSTTPANLILPAGSSIGINVTGTLTAAIGVVSVTLAPA